MSTNIGPMDNRRKDLEDLFFIKEDQKILDNLRALRKLQETKEALAHVSRIRNDAVLQKLVELGVRPETLVSLRLIPLVEMAWACGSVDEKEKAAVFAAAEHDGWAKDQPDYKILEQWMEHRPDPKLLEAWLSYVRGLAEHLSPAEKAQFKKDLMTHAHDIATASGGLLGLRKISPGEAEMLKKLDAAF